MCAPLHPLPWSTTRRGCLGRLAPSLKREIIAYVAFVSRYPSDPEERACGERWMDWQLSVLREATHGMFWGLVRTKPKDQNYEAIAASRQKSADAFAILDRYLAETEYAAGSRFTICDIPIGIFAHRWFGLDIEREEFPNLLRWYNDLGERPAYVKHVKVPLT